MKKGTISAVIAGVFGLAVAGLAGAKILKKDENEEEVIEVEAEEEETESDSDDEE